MLLYFFNYNFPLLWPFLLPFSIGFVATAPGKQWGIWKGRFCGKSMLGEKAFPKWRLIFLNPSFSNLQCCQKIQREKYFSVCFGLFFFFEGWGPFRPALPKIKILYWGNLSGTWDPHVLLVCPKSLSSPCPPSLSDEEQKRWRGEAVGPACSWHCADRDRYSCHGFLHHSGNFYWNDSSSTMWAWDQGESQVKSNGPAAAWFGELIMGQSLTHLGGGFKSISAAYWWQGHCSDGSLVADSKHSAGPDWFVGHWAAPQGTLHGRD